MRGIVEQQKQYKGSISESRGASGGITTLWNHSKWNYRSASLHQHWIKTVLENRVDNQIAIIYNIYVPNHFREKECYWDDLKASIDGEENSNIILGGDFNLILHANEKRGGFFKHLILSEFVWKTSCKTTILWMWLQKIEGILGAIAG